MFCDEEVQSGEELELEGGWLEVYGHFYGGFNFIIIHKMKK